jgi:hypothetical protein
MNNTTNHNTTTLFTAKNEERFLKTFERLVDHIVATQPDLETQAWLAKVKAPPTAEAIANAVFNQPIRQRSEETTKNINELRIQQLEKELAEANAKISRRL